MTYSDAQTILFRALILKPTTLHAIVAAALMFGLVCAGIHLDFGDSAFIALSMFFGTPLISNVVAYFLIGRKIEHPAMRYLCAPLLALMLSGVIPLIWGNQVMLAIALLWFLTLPSAIGGSVLGAVIHALFTNRAVLPLLHAALLWSISLPSYSSFSPPCVG